MQSRACRDPQEISEYLTGILHHEDAVRFEEHLDQCDHCLGILTSFESIAEDTLAELRHLPTTNVVEQELACANSIQAIKALADEHFVGKRLFTSQAHFELPAQLRDYQLLRLLGQGGMGSVYQAVHTRLQRPVALKVLLTHRMESHDAVRRFEREMQLVGNLRNPHVVGAIDAGEHEGTHYLVMELIHGADLSSMIRQVGPLSIADACEVARQTTAGLQYIHEQGMVHRDIKPSNLMLANEGESPLVKILDLGLARLNMHDQADELTNSGQLMGTLDYMAPEQTRARDQVDSRADIYALGATLFKLLTGKAPFETELHDTSVKKLRAVDSERPPLVSMLRPEVPKPLVRLIDRMLSKSPARRPATAADVARLLEPYAKGHQLSALLSRSLPTEIDGSAAASTPPYTNEVTSVEPSADPKDSLSPPSTNKFLWLAALGLPALFLLATVIYFTLPGTTEGVVRLEINDPEMEVKIGDNSYTIVNSGEEIRISPGDKALTIRRGELQFETTRLQIGKGKNPDLLVEYLDHEAIVDFAGRRRRLESQGATIPSVPAASQPHASDSDSADELAIRAAAKWLMEQGATLHVVVGKASIELVSPSELPIEPFTVNSVELKKLPIFTLEHGRHLAQFKQLERLVISADAVASGATAPLAGLTALQYGSIRGTEFRGGRMAFLASLSAIRELHLQEAMDEASIKYLAPLAQLESLYLSDSRATGRGFSQLKHLKHLQMLNMGQSQLDDEGMKEIAAIPALTSFWAIRTKLSDAGLRHFQGHPAIQTLILQDTAVTDEGLPSLYDLNLQSVFVVNTAVTMEGARELQKHVPGCVVELGTKANRIVLPAKVSLNQQQQRVIARRVIEAGGLVNRSQDGKQIDAEDFAVREVLLSDIDDSLLASLAGDLAGFHKLHTLIIEGRGLTSASLPVLARLPVSTLFLSGVDATEDEYRVLSRMPHLTRLTLTEANTAGEFVRAASHLPQLTFLGLQGCPLSDQELLRPLTQLKALEMIFIATDDVDDQCIDILQEIPTLTSIRLSSDQLTDAIWHKLATMPQLQEINLNPQGDANEQMLRGEGISALAALPNLRILALNLCPFSEQGWQQLGEVTQLERLLFHETKIQDQHLANLHNLTGLKYLELHATQVTPAGVASLQAALPDCQINVPQ